MFKYYIDIESGQVIGMEEPREPINGLLLCNGALLKREEYPKLFEAIGERYGKGDGETTFSIPTFRQAEQERRRVFTEFGVGAKIKLEKDSSSREKGRGLQDWESNPDLPIEQGGPSDQLDDPELEAGEIPITPPQPR
jgi:hypothetical protein